MVPAGYDWPCYMLFQADLGCCGIANTAHGCCRFCICSIIQKPQQSFVSHIVCASTQVASQQNAVSQKLHMLETHQKETHDSLVQMERTAISMYQVMHVIR